MIVNKIICDGGLKFGRRFDVDSLESPSGEMVELWYDYVTTHDYLSVIKRPVDRIRHDIFKFIQDVGVRLIDKVSRNDDRATALKEFVTLCEYVINTLTIHGDEIQDATHKSLDEVRNIHITDSGYPGDVTGFDISADMNGVYRNILLDMHNANYDAVNVMVVWAPTDITIPIQCRMYNDHDVRRTVFRKCIEAGVIKAIEIEVSSIYPEYHSYSENR